LGTDAIDWMDVATARTQPGLRLVLTQGVPGPWGESAKGIFHVKRIPFARVAQRLDGDNAALRAWTGRDDAPIAVWNDERPRDNWMDVAWLAERIAPEPRLIPASLDERTAVFGLGRELCGEQGLGWLRRLMLIDALKKAAPDLPVTSYLERRYGWDARLAAAAPQRVADILRAFSAQLASQRERGRRYLAGDAITALDVWWAAFAAMVDALPHELCPMDAGTRSAWAVRDPVVRAAIDPALLAHRDFVYREHLELPVRL
jgi:glutathione S-transferase